MGREVYRYLVEGPDEKNLVDTLKSQLPPYVKVGKVEVFNVVQKKITLEKIRTWPKDVIVILIFDTDTENTSILSENIRMLNKNQHIGKVLCIPQYRKLEDEIARTIKAKSALDLFATKSKGDFKTMFANEKELMAKLQKWDFDFSKLWTKQPPEKYRNAGVVNNSDKVKLR
ncbi:MAG: hypothetical protein IJ708_03985 [Clostridia bacterium]|nr:hypothetical protein [Clostridia bacterium]